MSIYNEREEWIKGAVDSILNQTFSDFEFIIINDNPQKEQNKIVLENYQAKDKRIRIIENEENIGLTKSLNKALKITRGEYIARMDADDISFPKRFEKQIEFLDRNPDYIVCGAYVKHFGESKRLLKFGQDWQKLKANFLIPNPTSSPIAHPVAMIRHRVLQENNIYYNEEYAVGQDYELWSRLLFEGKFYNIQEPLLHYRVSREQISSKQKNKQLSVIKRVAPTFIRKYLQNLDTSIDLSSLDNIVKESKRNKRKRELKSFLVSVIGFELIYNKSFSKRALFFFLSQKDICIRTKVLVLYNLKNNLKKI